MREKHIGFRITLPCLFLFVFGLLLPCGMAFGDERIPIATPAISKKQMAKVFFSHDKHVEVVDAKGGDCSSCHNMTDSGMSETLKDVNTVSKEKQVNYMHVTCTECHAKAGKGPRLVDCRVCHSERIASKFAGKK